MRTFARTGLLAIACAAVLGSVPAFANSAAVDYFRNRADRSAVPSLLSHDDREYYRQVFDAIDRKDWNRVQQLFTQRPDGPLHQQAKAEYYLAAGSPKIDASELQAWLAQGTELPDADQISRLALKRGAESVPALPTEQQFARLPSITKRIKPASINDGTMPGNISAGILDRIKNDDPMGARVLVDGIDAVLSPSARAEWKQRVAWSFYIENQDAPAYEVAQLAATQGQGPWVGEAWWTAGLAAWRLGDCEGAADAFRNAAQRSDNDELRSASYYWQGRALVRCRKPEQAGQALRAAAARDETLYGMLAAEQLGLKLPEQHAGADFSQADWQQLRSVGNIRVAVELAEIGKDGLADEVLRHQARIGSPSQFEPLTRLARDLGLPSTQLWLAYNAPYGGKPEPATRFPTPKWTPVGGWSVDPALVYAHALQESVFRANVVSPAGARGLMQIMPAAAQDHADSLGYTGSPSDLNKPEVNLAFGQRHLDMLRNSPGTQGLLPKVMAAYNAGIAPVMRWNSEVRDQGDPLLWMESIPYWETRGYVNIVLRNYWMYERQAGGDSESRMALAEGMWPTFPGLSGSQGVRMAANGAIVRAR
ncbi:lytic transglycosylase domain-containing protein [Novosphingobium album (ex Liu et al. 2023)]|uniref:Lytic transglycosylase domain-containing protein n=1 Tax=Novosphingobium album (ex Liu et al. 2023) TaxID=3031130 RepID=A0ABT5WRT2_9SPHN|nr:lytic transglycosylase domain-containing protein [Novosphingobium album (ex Liu et al. 2023)]MDE8652728.1 lytic transglycosylase domain-containing protein [Novosphingobium album (ex Liu et al. 2023)]